MEGVRAGPQKVTSLSAIFHAPVAANFRGVQERRFERYLIGQFARGSIWRQINGMVLLNGGP